jgi:hypothetical protein
MTCPAVMRSRCWPSHQPPHTAGACPARSSPPSCAWGRQRRFEERAIEIQAALRSEQLEAPPAVADAMGAYVAALVAVITELVIQTRELEVELDGRDEALAAATCW